MRFYEVLVCEIKVDLATHDNSVTIVTKHFCFAIFCHILNLPDHFFFFSSNSEKGREYQHNKETKG